MTRRLPGLDGLRGLAVIAVVAFHLWPGAVPGGWLGVDVFFVLSGFLITGLLVQELAGAAGPSDARIALGGFWSRRAKRLLPAALLTITAVAVVGHWLLDPWRLSALRGDALASLAYVANWHFIATGSSYFASGTRSPLEHLWSLAIEEQFYLLWPLLVAGLWRVCGGRRRQVATLVLGLAALSAVAMALLAERPGSRAYFGTDTRAQALLVGAALALVTGRGAAEGRRWRWVSKAGGPALVALVASCLVLDGSWRWLYRGGFTALALASAAVVASVASGTAPRLDRILGWAPLGAVGRVSYGLYLWHWPVIVMMGPGRTHVDGAALDLLHIALFSALTVASYHLVEMPIRRAAWRPREVAFGAAAAVALAGLVAVAAGIGSSDPPSLLQAQAGSIATVPGPPQGSTPSSSPPAGASPASEPLQVGVVGDSIAFTLVYKSAEMPGVELQGGGTIGCGVIPNKRCEKWDELWRIVGEGSPDVVVVLLGAWEMVAQDVAGVPYRPGTAAARALVTRQLEAGLELLDPDSKVALLDVPCLLAIDGDGQVPDSLIDWVNDVFADFAEAHPGRVTLVPVSQLLCPDGRTDTAVDGVTLRPEGRHFDERSAPIVWRWLLPRLRQIAG